MSTNRATPASIRKATRTIRDNDPAFAAIIESAGPCTLAQRSDDDSTPYSALVTSVVSQQLSTPIARLITQRLRDLAGHELRPQDLRRLSIEDLRSVGLSGAKARTIMELTEAVNSGSLDLDELAEHADEEQITTALTQLWGIGTWTAHMFLIFHLGRLDVWPSGDLGVRKGWAVIHGESGDPGAATIHAAADHLAPYRSVAAWYCWRSWEAAS